MAKCLRFMQIKSAKFRLGPNLQIETEVDEGHLVHMQILVKA